MRDPAAGRYVHVKPRQLPRECLHLPKTPAGTDRRA